jgi:hypothetical protein
VCHAFAAWLVLDFFLGHQGRESMPPGRDARRSAQFAVEIITTNMRR